MNWNQNSGPSKLKVLSLIAAGLMLGSTSSVWALGTASGTTIVNQATLNYSVGGVAQAGVLSDGDTATAGVQTTDFKVDNKIIVTVTKVDAARVTAVGGQVAATPVPNPPAYLTYQVSNTGNTTQDYKLTNNNLAVGAADPFTGVTTFVTANCRTFVESGATAGLQIGTDPEVTYINDLAADATKNVYLVCDVPAAATNGQTGSVGLTAEAVDAAGTVAAQSASYTAAQLTAANTQAGVEIVAADLAGSEGDIVRDAKHSARDTYIVATASLAVTKTVTPICDPFNGKTNPKNIPGAAVQYAITIANTGSAAATLTTVSDTLAATLAFDPKLNSGAAPAANCVSGNAANTLSASGFGAVTGTGVGPGVTAPGLAAHAVTAGAAVAAGVVTVTYNVLATSAITAPAAASLAAGDYITVYFNSFVQ
ncbi:MAG: hypothetical protein WBP13_03695 [Methylophilaceae bacterium]